MRGFLNLKYRRGPMFLRCSNSKSENQPSDELVCADMKKTRLEDVLNCLENLSGEVKVIESVRGKALAAVERMIGLG